MYRLISAAPSPYARKIRIQLAEKNLPFELLTEVPWNEDTSTPDHNPLEKLPVLIPERGEPVYDSRHIFEWVETRHPEPPLLPADPWDRLAVRRFEVLADGVCDALVLMLFENARGPENRSQPWFDRQSRKVEGGLRELARLSGDGDFAWGERFTLADIALGSAVKYLELRWPRHPWRADHPRLAELSDRLERRPTFAATVPTPQAIRDRVT